MDYENIIKYWLKAWHKLVLYAETFNWLYIGAGIFIVLFVYFLYDLFGTSQVSIKFMLAIGVFMFLIYYFGAPMFGGMVQVRPK